MLERADARDALLTAQASRARRLPRGARVGTSSLRRQAQLLAVRPDLRIETLRGNVDTRLRRLDAGEMDAIVLACAGLIRLGLESRITARLDPKICLPAVAQGVIGIECRRDDARTQGLVTRSNHRGHAHRHGRGARICASARRQLSIAHRGACTAWRDSA